MSKGNIIDCIQFYCNSMKERYLLSAARPLKSFYSLDIEGWIINVHQETRNNIFIKLYDLSIGFTLRVFKFECANNIADLACPYLYNVDFAHWPVWVNADLLN